MARIRTVKPQHWSDKELAKIPLQAHLLWIALWNFSDDEGVFENDPILIKSQVFPRRTDVRVEQVSQWIDQLVKARFVVPFEYNGSGYYIHRTFKTHQKIDKPQPSKIPSEIIQRILDECSENDQPCIVKESIVEEGRVEPTREKIEETILISPKNQKEKEKIAPGAEIFYSIEHCLVVAMNDDRWVKDSKATEEKLLLFNQFLSGQGVYEKNPMDYKKHFYNWSQKQKNATHKQPPAKSTVRKSAGAEQLLASLKTDIAGLNGPGSEGY